MGLRLMTVGASSVVPGSHYIVSSNNHHYSLDLGGIPDNECIISKSLSTIYPLPHLIDATIFSHGHFDHIGKMPKFVRDYGYRGPMYGTYPTLDILALTNRMKKGFEKYNEIYEHILNGNIGDVENAFIDLEPTRPDHYDFYLNKTHEQREKTIRRWSAQVPSSIETLSDLFLPKGFYDEVQLDENLSFQFLKSSHILGSSQVLFNYEGGKTNQRLLYTGDIGYENCFFGSPDVPKDIDHLILDCTNANKEFNSNYDPRENLKDIINSTIGRGGQVYIAAFTLNRIQMVLNYINDLFNKGEIPRGIDYYLDSPTGSRMTEYYKNKTSWFDKIKNKDNPFLIRHNNRISKSTKRSKDICKQSRPYVMLTAPGMIDKTGRIMNHLIKDGENRGIQDPRNSLVICGHQATNLGKTLLDSIDDKTISTVRIPKYRRNELVSNEEYQIKAEIHSLQNLSGHLFKDHIINFLKIMKPKNTFLVHADQHVRVETMKYLNEMGLGGNVYSPGIFDVFDLSNM